MPLTPLPRKKIELRREKTLRRLGTREYTQANARGLEPMQLIPKKSKETLHKCE